MNKKDYLLTILTAFGSLLGSFFMNLYTKEQLLIGIGGFIGVITGMLLTSVILISSNNNKSKVKLINIKWPGYIYILSNLILISTITSFTFWPIFASPQLEDSRNVFLYSIIILGISFTSFVISNERLKALNINFNEPTEELKKLWSFFFKTLGVGLVIFLILLLLLPIKVNMIIFIVFIPLLLFNFKLKKTDNINKRN